MYTSKDIAEAIEKMILPLEDVIEMRRQGFDDRVMEGPQNARQEFLLV
jgi:hypothetical protein